MQWKHNKIRCRDSLETILMQQIVNNEIGANFLLYRYKTFITVIVSIQLCLWVWVSKLSLSLFFFFVFTLPVFVFILSQWTVHLILIGSTRSSLSSCFYVGTFHFLCTCLSCCYIQPVFRRFWPLCFCRYYCFGGFFSTQFWLLPTLDPLPQLDWFLVLILGWFMTASFFSFA